MQRTLSRRGLLGFMAASAAAAACGRAAGPRSPVSDAGTPATSSLASSEATASRTVAPATAVAPTVTPVPPTPTATPWATGSTVRLLLPGTPHETPAHIHHSGIEGPVAMVLGGVHGNEPGGWLAVDEIAGWRPATGSLVVVPRANVTAIAAFVRTFDEIGDLNRLYPGDASSQLMMERMAHELLGLAREFDVELLLDMHESWAFYAEYPPNSGTGALGQTLTVGVGPLHSTFGQAVADRVNPLVSAREQMILRDGTRFRRQSAVDGQANRGRSSLSAGGHVPGLTPVLVEMGQENQDVERRMELHLVVVRESLGVLGMALA